MIPFLSQSLRSQLMLPSVVDFVRLEPRHVLQVAREIREADRQELIAAHGDPSMFAILEKSIAVSKDIWAAQEEDNQDAICIFGIAPIGGLLTPVAAPWLIGTDRVGAHASALIRASRKYILSVRERYPTLVNFVDSRNTDSIKYLKALGFTLDEAQPFGAAELPFHRFHMGLEG
jgi:hypothetical protein